MISKRMFSGLQATALVLGVGLMAGCASTASNEQIEQAQSDAQEALQMAREAKQEAQAASETARAAQSAASAAEECCASNKAKIDRMMQRSQQK